MIKRHSELSATKCQIQDYQNKNSLSVCSLLLLQWKTSNVPHKTFDYAVRSLRLDITALDLLHKQADLNSYTTRRRTAGLHNSENLKGQIDQRKLAAGRKSLFRGRGEEILKGQVIIRSRAFATFSAAEFSRAACCAGLPYCLYAGLISTM